MKTFALGKRFENIFQQTFLDADPSVADPRAENELLREKIARLEQNRPLARRRSRK